MAFPHYRELAELPYVMGCIALSTKQAKGTSASPRKQKRKYLHFNILIYLYSVNQPDTQSFSQSNFTYICMSENSTGKYNATNATKYLSYSRLSLLDSPGFVDH